MERLKEMVAWGSEVLRSESLAGAAPNIELAVKRLTGATEALLVLLDPGSNGRPETDEVMDRFGDVVTSVVRKRQLVHLSLNAGQRTGGSERQKAGRISLLAAPIFGSEGKVEAVLVAVKNEGQSQFEAVERATFETICSYVLPLADRSALARKEHCETQKASDRSEDLFNREALDAYFETREFGNTLHLAPQHLRIGSWVLVALLGVAVCYLALGSIPTYARGHGYIVYPQMQVLATESGLLETLAAFPGKRLGPEDPIGHLRVGEDVSKVLMIGQMEFRQPIQLDSSGPFSPVVSVESAATVVEILSKPGNYVEEGAALLSVIAEGSSPWVVGVLPSRYASSVVPGQTMTWESGDRGPLDSEIITVGGPEAGTGALRGYLKTLGIELGQVSQQNLLIIARPSSANVGSYVNGAPGRVSVKLGWISLRDLVFGDK